MRVLLLVSTTSYRAEDLGAAARRLGAEALLGTDRCHKLAELWPREAFGGSLPLNFRDHAEAAAQIAEEAARQPIAAIVPTDETTAQIAARAAALLGLPGNPPHAADVARDKDRSHAALDAAGVRCAAGASFPVADDPETRARAARYPCVLKPLLLSASRGVIRADDVRQFVAAWRRIAALLDTPALRAIEDPAGHRIRVETFVPGAEVAVEGILARGRLRVLALFDKPDPLDGPLFEETIYVTPSRHPLSLQAAIAETTQRAAAAIGLVEGPIHAELRLPPDGVPSVLEVAARSIGGLCARTLRYALPRAEGEGVSRGATGLQGASLEEIVLRHALGLPVNDLERRGASGVMMIPMPGAGVLQSVHGVDAARAVPLVEDVVISARPGDVLVPLPEGSSYFGFIFARGDAPDAVEAALRAAHGRLRAQVAPRLATAVK
jgi:biotin carboxylase